MLTTSPADCSALILPDLHSLAIQTGLIIRKSPKFTADGFLQSLLSSVVTGHGSTNQIASELKERVGHSMSRQSLHDRFGISSTAFLILPIPHPVSMRNAFSSPRISVHNASSYWNGSYIAKMSSFTLYISNQSWPQGTRSSVE